MTEHQINKGDYLIALPSAYNPNDVEFNQSVILLTDHNIDGCMGFILNKPTPYLLSELVPESSGAFTVYHGGPVESDRLFCIHKCPDLIPDSIAITDQLYWGGDFNSIFNHIEMGLLTHLDLRFFMGYSGWDNGQLEMELSNQHWIKTDNLHFNPLEQPTKTYWKEAMQTMGKDFSIWLNAPENPNLN
ncbi:MULTISPECIES: YqgE/AlgH family protein [unclassified Myroides]|uniref:YqgE/AlgH family protein n=1 Tax=unclassified Myroides TaxID=2642485 RepID=UPI003D2F56CF